MGRYLVIVTDTDSKAPVSGAAVELGGEGPVCALGTLYFSGDVRKAFAELVKG